MKKISLLLIMSLVLLAGCSGGHNAAELTALPEGATLVATIHETDLTGGDVDPQSVPTPKSDEGYFVVDYDYQAGSAGLVGIETIQAQETVLCKLPDPAKDGIYRTDTLYYVANDSLLFIARDANNLAATAKIYYVAQ